MSSVPVCRFYAEGFCKFGDNCRNYHPPKNDMSAFRQGSGGRGFGGTSNVPTGNRTVSQAATGDDAKYLFNTTTIPTELQHQLPNWIISSFGLAASNPNLFTEPDFSQEEMRWKCVQAVKAGNPQQYVAEENELLNKAKQNISLALANPAQTVAIGRKLHDARFINGLQPGGNRPADFDEAKILASSSTPSQPSSSTPAFGQSTFGQASTPAFGSSSFGQSSKPSAFGSGASAFGGGSAGTSAFGSSGFGQKPTGTAFGAPAANSPFGAASGTSPAAPAFGAASKPAFGSSAFGSASGAGSTTFGQSSFKAKPAGGFGSTSSPSAFGSSAPTAPAAFGAAKPAFGASAATPAFGQSATPAPAFGSSTFGSPAASTSGGGFGQSAFGQSSKPAAFGATTTPTSTFGSTSTPAQIAAFGTTSTPSFGQSAFGQSLTSSNPFGSNAPKDITAASPTTSNPFSSAATPASSNPFGQSATQTSSPSAQANPFAQKLASSSSAFGQANTPANPFASSTLKSASFPPIPASITGVTTSSSTEWSYDDPWSYLLPTPDGTGDDKLDDEVVKLFQAPTFSLANIPSIPPPVALRS